MSTTDTTTDAPERPPWVNENGECYWLDADGDPLPVHVLWGRILAELPPIGKTQQNKEQGFMFRGHDDVMNAYNPLASRYGVFVTPEVVERIAEKRSTRAGGVLYEVNLYVRYTIHGPAGDELPGGSAWGEGTDSGDKATNKAMTAAFKYWLGQTLALSTKEMSDTDADRHTPPETADGVEGEARTYVCPRCKETGTTWEHIDQEKFRAHMISKHDYVRLPDGRVTKPDTADAEHARDTVHTEAEGDGPEPAADNGRTRAPEPVRGQPSPEEMERLKEMAAGGGGAQRSEHTAGNGDTTATATEDGAPTDDTETCPDCGHTLDDCQCTASEEDIEALATWVQGLKGDGLTEELVSRGLPKSGSAAEKRNRLQGEILAGNVDWPADEDLHPEGEDEPDGSGDAPTEDGQMFSGGAPAEPAAPTGDPELDSPCPAETIAIVKGEIGKLRGESARAFAAYRRERNLPKPEDMTFGQALETLDFIEKTTAA